MSEEFPQSISTEEQGLGFQLQPIAGLSGSAPRKSEKQLVVAMRLSAREILLKAYDLDGRICYYHKKYGYDVLFGQETPYQWYPVSGGWEYPKEILRMYKAGIKTLWEKQVGQIHGVPYRFETARNT